MAFFTCAAALGFLARTKAQEADAPVAEAKPETTVRTGDHVQVVLHFEHADCADQALRVAELTWQKAAEMFDTVTPDEPREVHVYATADAYRAADQKLTGGEFQRNLAFAHFDERSAHVALQPELSSHALDAIGLGYQTVRLIAHETMHLCRYEAFHNFRSHPGWFHDGLATWVEIEVLRELGYHDSLDESPEFSNTLRSIARLFESGEFPPIEKALVDETPELDFDDRYAVHWWIFHCANEGDHEALRECLGTMRSEGGGSGYKQRAAAAFLQTLYGGSAERGEKALRRAIARHEPRWSMPFRVFETTGRDWEQTAFDTNAIAWRQQDAGKRFRIRGEVKILPGRREQMNVLLGRNDDGFVSLAITAGVGIIVFRFDSRTDEWERVAEVRRAIPTGEFLPFEIQTKTSRSGSSIRMELQGREILTLDLDAPLDGQWGLGAQNGSAGIWRDIETKRR